MRAFPHTGRPTRPPGKLAWPTSTCKWPLLRSRPLTLSTSLSNPYAVPRQACRGAQNTLCPPAQWFQPVPTGARAGLWQGAFAMLQNFQHVRSREAINRQLRLKYDDVLTKFCQELDDVDKIFQQHRAHPPAPISMPPVAGAAKWARGLFQRVKATILLFQQRPALLESAAGQEASQRYPYPFFPARTHATPHACTFTPALACSFPPCGSTFLHTHTHTPGAF